MRVCPPFASATHPNFVTRRIGLLGPDNVFGLTDANATSGPELPYCQIVTMSLKTSETICGGTISADTIAKDEFLTNSNGERQCARS